MAPACFEILPWNTFACSCLSANLFLLCSLYGVSSASNCSRHGTSSDVGSKYKERWFNTSILQGGKSCLFYKDLEVYRSKEMHCRRGGICKSSRQQTVFIARSVHSAVCSSGSSPDSISGACLWYIGLAQCALGCYIFHQFCGMEKTTRQRTVLAQVEYR